jgi:hypothetical protein
MTNFNSRVLCSDGTCIGVIGADGKCKECGKPHNRYEDDIASGKEKFTPKNNIIFDLSKEDNSVKCKTCGFIAFGDDPATAKYTKCLGCGNIMGEEFITKKPSSSNESLLETCQNCKHQFSKRASICPKCNKERTADCFVCNEPIPQSSKYCPECGDPAPFEQKSTEKNTEIGDFSSKEVSISTPSAYREDNGKNIEFTGSAFGLFGRGLLTTVLFCFVIPAPWIFSWFCRWFVQNIRKAGDTTLSFSGRGSQIWFPVMAASVLPQVGRFLPKLPFDPAVNLLLYLLLYLSLSCYFNLVIAKWLLENVVSSTGTKTSFVGEYFPYLGWNLLSLISLISVIGWAWVNAGMARWFCRNIRSSNNHIVEFHGKGWDILWRTVVYLFSYILIIPIPWTSLWLIKWYVHNLTVEKYMANGKIAEQ